MFCVPVPDRSGQVTPPGPTVAFVLFNNTLLQVKSSRGQQSDQQRSLMDQIMLGQQQDTNNKELSTAAKTPVAASKRTLVEDEDKAFEDWKQGILRRAVEAGFEQYSKYLRPTTTTSSA